MGSNVNERCRFCSEPLVATFCDLGLSPLSNSYVPVGGLTSPETFYPLHAKVCGSCFLVQLPQFESPKNIFGDYAYFSSYSHSWLEHCRSFSQNIIEKRKLGRESRVVEIASNDGYLLRNFIARGIPCIGVEPAANVAEVALAAGVPTVVRFFGRELAVELRDTDGCADLIIANNVFAHVPDLNDFVAGIKVLLAAKGLATLEFPHLLRLIRERQFDTIYHEHFSYFSLLTAARIFEFHGLAIVDVEQLATHGGSLRIHVAHSLSVDAVSERVANVIAEERAAGLDKLATYDLFRESANDVKRALLTFLIDAKRAGNSVVAYGAAAKGNTLLNFCGIRCDFVDYVVDRNPYKQGKYLPGTRIPILAPERVRETRPNYLLILPWNLRTEILDQMSYLRDWGGKFVVPIPSLQVID